MHRVLIVEDSAAFARRISELVQQAFFSQAAIRVCSSAEEYFSEPRELPEIALLDIELPGESGISLAHRINQTAPACQIVYLTSHLDYAVDVYQTRHFWFVTKDRMEELLPGVLQQALEQADRCGEKMLLISSKPCRQQLRQSEILYLERVKRKSSIVTGGGEFQCAESLDELYLRLDPEVFVRCHNSYIVNLEHVRTFQRTQLVMDNESIILVSRSYQAALRDRFSEYAARFTGPFVSLA